MSLSSIIKIIRPQSLSVRIGLMFALIVLLLGGIQYFVLNYVWVRGAEELLQRLNWELADNYARELQPLLSRGASRDEVEHMLYTFMSHNPHVDITILSEDGTILYDLRAPSTENLPRLDTTELKKALVPTPSRSFPIHAPNALKPQFATIFSVAPIMIGEKGGYVYVQLIGGRFGSLIEGVEAYYVTFGAVMVWLVLFLLLFAIGLLIFYTLTRRFRVLVRSVDSIAEGNLDARVPFGGSDEVGRLAEAVNSMASTIERNVGELAQRDQLRRALIADVSHDLRGPVTSIKGFLDVLTRMPREAAYEKFSEVMGSLKASADSLQRLLAELFELAKFEAKEQQPEMNFFDLEELLQETALGCAGVAEKSGVKLDLDCGENPLPVLADAGMLERAVRNLIENAIYYSPAGGTVAIRLTQEGDFARVSVIDQGVGIAPADVTKIVGRFERGESSKHSSRASSGLGLAIVQQILRLHSSEIEITSAEGQGSTFSFKIARANTC